ncbi:HNH endonuclease [Providencia rettgeri]|uniref:HNH endonuclease n=3 Tax=Providencia TaxID=586 RepID=A0AAD2VPT2_PRORE|nr:HNH endonuclease [Providencia rettgeri]MBV2187879.1 HNH endonuclease [Providencia rettgeri]
MGVAASGEIINISARIDDIPNEPIIHAGPSPLPQKIEKPEGFAIHESDTRPETLPIADDGIVWRHTGHDVEPVDFRDYILTVERKDVKPTYVSLRGKSVEEKLKARGYDDVIINENGGLDYSKSKALYHNPDRLKPDGTPVEPIVKIKYTGNYPDDFEAANMAGFGQKSTPMLDGERYLWHHLDDYDPITNEGTMQLVVSDSHNGIQHNGGVSQFKDTNNVSEYPFRLPNK